MLITGCCFSQFFWRSFWLCCGFGCDSYCFSWTEPGTFDPGNEGFTRLCVGPCWAELLSLPALLRASGDGQVVLTMSVAWLGGPCCEHILAGFFLNTLWGAAEHSGGSTCCRLWLPVSVGVQGECMAALRDFCFRWIKRGLLLAREDAEDYNCSFRRRQSSEPLFTLRPAEQILPSLPPFLFSFSSRLPSPFLWLCGAGISSKETGGVPRGSRSLNHRRPGVLWWTWGWEGPGAGICPCASCGLLRIWGRYVWEET